MILHNTDSVFFKFNLKDANTGKKIINKEALIYTIELAKQAGELASKFLKKPMSYFLDDYKELDVVAEEFNIAYEKERDNFYKEHQKTLGTE